MRTLQRLHQCAPDTSYITTGVMRDGQSCKVIREVIRQDERRWLLVDVVVDKSYGFRQWVPKDEVKLDGSTM